MDGLQTSQSQQNIYSTLKESIHGFLELILRMDMCTYQAFASHCQTGGRGVNGRLGVISVRERQGGLRESFLHKKSVRQVVKRRFCRGREWCRAISVAQVEFPSGMDTDLMLHFRERIDLIGKTVGPAIQYYRSLTAPSNKIINEVGLTTFSWESNVATKVCNYQPFSAQSSQRVAICHILSRSL